MGLIVGSGTVSLGVFVSVTARVLARVLVRVSTTVFAALPEWSLGPQYSSKILHPTKSENVVHTAIIEKGEGWGEGAGSAALSPLTPPEIPV